MSETEVSAESEVSYSKMSGTEVSKISLRFMYGLSIFFPGGSTADFGEVSEIKCLSVFRETLFRAWVCCSAVCLWVEEVSCCEVS